MRKLRLILILATVLSACASIPDDIRRLDDGTIVELANTPFFPQSRYQCGPAALTTALRASGADVSIDEMVRKVYLPGRQGSLQIEMIAATRTSGRIPYRIDASMAALVDELESNRPVVVLQNLGIAAIPRWHYAVVIGVDANDDRVILRSGTERRRQTSLKTFLRTWRRSDYWGFVALRPGEMPANPDRTRFLESLVAFESVAGAAATIPAWEAAVATWPADTLALFGLANAHYALGNFAQAEERYVGLLQLDASKLVARNNLAMALAQQQRFAEAIRQVDLGLTSTTDPEIAAEMRDTRESIISLRGD